MISAHADKSHSSPVALWEALNGAPIMASRVQLEELLVLFSGFFFLAGCECKPTAVIHSQGQRCRIQRPDLKEYRCVALVEIPFLINVIESLDADPSV